VISSEDYSKRTQRDMIIEMHKDIKYNRERIDDIYLQINGNGKKGIKQDIDSLKRFRYLITGGLIVVASLAAWGWFG